MEYDPESDAAYVRLAENKQVKDTTEIDEGIQADLDAPGNVIGIEILNFSKKRISLDELVSKGIENILVTK